jgi:pilus assembly protein CpaF
MASALDLIVHLSRLRDGTRRVTHVTEVQGMEGDMLLTQDLFLFDFGMGLDDDGKFLGHLKATGRKPTFTDRLIDNGVPVDGRWFEPEHFVRRAVGS